MDISDAVEITNQHHNTPPGWREEPAGDADKSRIDESGRIPRNSLREDVKKQDDEYKTMARLEILEHILGDKKSIRSRETFGIEQRVPFVFGRYHPNYERLGERNGWG